MPAPQTPMGMRQRAILVVEDDPDLQWKIARMLTLRGNRVVGTSSGEAALELIAQWPVDVVVLDETLPGMSGLELARRIHERMPHVPLVLLSESERPATELSPIRTVIRKPFRLDSILGVLRTLLGRLTFPPDAE